MDQLLAVLQEIALYLRLGLSRVPKTVSEVLVPRDNSTLLYSNQTDFPVRVLIQSQGILGDLLNIRNDGSSGPLGVVLEDLESVEWVFWPGERAYGFVSALAAGSMIVEVFEMGT